MANWSIPFIEHEFNRYAHIASQVEEAMIGEFISQVQGTSVFPLVELDTLQGLDYLRSRTIQHKDFTYRNVLVCHQPGRTPVPFAFKISDFGTSCNFSTPDQPRGNRTNMAPEVLWCLNAATGSDVFSWYCVMWELHSRSPLIRYKASPGQGYCRTTYAEDLCELLGVYDPENEDTFELGSMKALHARALHAKHKDTRPTVQMILNSLGDRGRCITDKYFVSMGLLCITLFPQGEAVPPPNCLNLARYQRLSRDISYSHFAFRTAALSIDGLGSTCRTDIIFNDDCVSEGLA
ncbi:hypothetical protein KUCAC02_033081 [Chaenocephalus aceratus]|nr:hypothetical protein KUCAC02_033081 [Chaenocephalus aceratus]